MNLLLFSPEDRIGPDRVRVCNGRLTHLRQVTGAGVGDTLRVGELGGLMGEGTILEIDAHQATLAVSLHEAPPARLPLCLVLALPRPKMLRRILRSVAEFGVPELHLIHSFRVEKSYWQSPLLAPAAMRGYLLQGIEQSSDTVLPDVYCHRRFKPFVEDTLPSLVTGKYALLAHPGDYPPCPRETGAHTVAVVGPEGGFIPYEVEALVAAGCGAVSLGPRILRVENAVTALLGKLF